MPDMTLREARYVNAAVNGESDYKALRQAGWSHDLAAHPARVITDEMRAEVERLREGLVVATIENGRINAEEIHDYLSDALRADMREIREDDGSFKPQSEWPDIWGRMMEAGDIEVEYLSERSHDGETKDKEGGWDVKGKVIKVKLKFASRVKLLELAMKHKAVDAMVQQKAGDTNILVVTADQARRVAGAKKRLAAMAAKEVGE